MAGRDAIPDLVADWKRYERSLLTKLANRDRELLELHRDYMRIDALLTEYRREMRKVWDARDAERIANRELAEAANV